MPSASAEGRDLKPTSKKLRDAKKKGNLPRAKEFPSLSSFVLVIIFIWVFAYAGIEELKELLADNLLRMADLQVNASSAPGIISDTVYTFLRILAPFFIFLFVIAILFSTMWQGGFVLTAKGFKINFNKMNPAKGIKKLLGSKDSWMNFAKSVVLIAIIGSFTVNTLVDLYPQLAMLHNLPLMDSLSFIFDELFRALLILSLLFIIIAIADLAWTKYSYTDKQKMSRQELKDENKTSDGDPQIKRRIRTIQYQMHRRRMMSEVPKADVVITNPVHVAVAIVYDSNKFAAPEVVAKGQGLIAARIKEIASDNDVPVVENPPLARTLFQTVELGEHVPPDLYKAVAEVLAHVYKLKGGSPT